MDEEIGILLKYAASLSSSLKNNTCKIALIAFKKVDDFLFTRPLQISKHFMTVLQKSYWSWSLYTRQDCGVLPSAHLSSKKLFQPYRYGSVHEQDKPNWYCKNRQKQLSKSCSRQEYNLFSALAGLLSSIKHGMLQQATFIPVNP